MDRCASRCEHVLVLEVKFICVLVYYASTDRRDTDGLTPTKNREAHSANTRHHLLSSRRLCIPDPTPAPAILTLIHDTGTSREVFN